EQGKLIPPDSVLRDELRTQIRTQLRQEITAQILADAGVEDRVKGAFAAISDSVSAAEAELRAKLEHDLKCKPVERWTVPVARLAARLGARSAFMWRVTPGPAAAFEQTRRELQTKPILISIAHHGRV